MEDEFSADTAETIEVGEYGRIEVYERQSKNKGKYSFQVRRMIRDYWIECNVCVCYQVALSVDTLSRHV